MILYIKLDTNALSDHKVIAARLAIRTAANSALDRLKEWLVAC